MVINNLRIDIRAVEEAKSALENGTNEFRQTERMVIC